LDAAIILVGRKTSDVVENADESSFGEGQHLGTRPAIFDDFFKTYCPVFR
jgi:hypothetical protein